MKCDWIELRLDMRIPQGTPYPTEEQWEQVLEIFGAESLTGGMKSYRKFNEDASGRADRIGAE
jgi:hypothetical protein